MKTIAKYEKDCEPQRYCILYHMSNAHCALSPYIHGLNARAVLVTLSRVTLNAWSELSVELDSASRVARVCVQGTSCGS